MVAAQHKITRADVEATFRRPGPMMPGPQVPMAQHPQQAQILQQQLANQAQQEQLLKQHEHDRNRSRIPTDRQIPPGVEELIIGDGVKQYNALRDIERKLDSTMMRKRLDISDSVQRRPKQYGTMRIWITNTVENQPWQPGGMDHDNFNFNTNIEATYKVTIVGKLLDTGSTSESEPSPSKTSSMPGSGRTKLSQFFKAVTIEFDRPTEFQPDNFDAITWRRDQPGAPPQPDFDRIEFTRKSDVSINVNVNLVRDEEPQRYRLREPLARLLDMEEADRQTVLMALWDYIRAHNLQHDPDTRAVTCDAALRDVFQAERLFLPQLPRIIEHLMLDTPPVILPYTIRVDPTFHARPESQRTTIYDVPVPLDDPLHHTMLSILSSRDHQTTLSKVVESDQEIALLVQKMNQAKAKHDFFTSMSKDPANFIRRWTSSQKRDLDVIYGAGAWGDEDWQAAEWRKGGEDGPWGSRDAIEGIGTYLSRQDVIRAQAQLQAAASGAARVA